MNYLSAINISKSYGIRTLFSEVEFHVNQGEQIALVAKNGSGKSTLLRMLAGLDNTETGEIILQKDVKIVLFEQTDNFNNHELAESYIFNHENPLLSLIKEYEKRIVENPGSPEFLELLEKMDQNEAWGIEALIEEIISKLKIDFLNQKIGKLSGGQRKRIALAKFLIDISLESGHLLLILDEPTNHLDIEMVEWLEFFLNKENKTLILVTHDRYFLDAICTKVFELEDQTIYTHNGNYETYITNKATRIENLTAEIGKAKNLYKKELEWMRRQPKARTTKSKSRISDFHETKLKAAQRIKDKKIQLEIQMQRLGNKLISFENAYKKFNDKIILKDYTHNFLKGNKIGIIGKNGVGKTTFLKIIEGTQMLDSGKIERGETLKIGHFKQDGIIFKEEQRVIDFVKDIAEQFPLANGKIISAGQFLELFLFEPQQQYTPIGKLSGGEKKRLQLLAVLYENPNLLILDEPTNDLDLPTLTVLEDFLESYPGFLLIVSHDRYFMDKVVDELIIFEGEGKLTPFIGNYTEYFIQKREAEILVKQEVKVDEKTADIITKPLNKKLSFKEQQELKEINVVLPKLEKKKLELTAKLSEPNLSFEELQKIGVELKKTTESIEEKEFRWLELNE